MKSNTVFSQILQPIFQYLFKKCGESGEGDEYTT